MKDTNLATPISTSTTTGSPATVPHDSPDAEPLISFADMIFGGKLTSILVCQKCKHISQTYEDFNDISLSIKPEDYFFGRGSHEHGRKTEKLKKLAKKLTTFPGTGGGGSTVTQSPTLNTNSTVTKPPFRSAFSAIEIQRSSSVPPSPSRSRTGDGNAHSDSEDDSRSSLVEPLRRKSFDSAKMSAVGPISRVDVDVETPPSSAVEAEDATAGVGGAEVELEVIAPAALSEEAEMSRMEPSEQGAVAALENPKEDRVGEDEIIMDSDSSHVLVHVVSPEERHVELVEPTKEKDGKDKDKKEDAGWAKLGRRISIMTGGLGISKDKEKTKGKEKDKKRWSMDRSGLGLTVPGSMQKSTSDTGVSEEPEKPRISSEWTIKRSRTSTAIPVPGKEASLPIAATASSNSGSASTAAYNIFKPLPRASSSVTTSTLNSTAPTTVSTTQQQNQHIAIPAPTAAESEYLRKILADVASSGLNSPFSLFKPPALLSGTHPFSTLTSSGLTGSSGNGGGAGMWLGLNHLSGIEECLRLFTAVEVLDGENMVGCRRCWKIANGVFNVKDLTRQEEEDSDQEQEQEECLDGSHETQTEANGIINQDKAVLANEHGLKKPSPALEIISTANVNTPTHIPTSVSTPTVSLYTLPNASDSRSVSSLPTEAISVPEGNEDSSLLEVSPKESGDDNDNGLLLRGGPGGMLIPIISTTSPLDTPTDARTSFAPAQRLAVSAKESVVESSVMDGAGDRNRTINGVLSGQGPSINYSTFSSAYVTPLSSAATPSLTQALSGYNASASKDSLLIPKKPRHLRRRTDDSSTTTSVSTTENESSDDEESDTSIVTSGSGESSASASVTDGAPSNVHRSMLMSQPKPQAQVQASAQQTSSSTQQPKLKEKKPKPVIMRPAYKRYLIALPPPVLVIHLKRFQQISKMPLISFSHGLKKLDDYVSFPEYLNLTPFLAPKKEDYGLGKKKKKRAVKATEEKCRYRLYAVVVHIGNMVSSSFRLASLWRWLMRYTISARWTLYSLHSFTVWTYLYE